LGASLIKAACKMLVKLTPGLNFINVVSTYFTLADPKSVKRYCRLDLVLTLLGSAHVKAVLRTLMILAPGRGRFQKYCGLVTAMTIIQLFIDNGIELAMSFGLWNCFQTFGLQCSLS